ncbi:MAG: hypothetical protein JKY37_02145 [Nannocystaceae bacterium]|nr:hypothetical protein [Nannocystaceae bacterium]
MNANMDPTWAKISHSVANDIGPIVDPSGVGSPASAAASMTPWAKGLLVAALGGAAAGGAAYWGGNGEINEPQAKVAIAASEQTRSDIDAPVAQLEDPRTAPDLESDTPPAAPPPEAIPTIAHEMHSPVPPVTDKPGAQTRPSKRPSKTQSRPREATLVPSTAPELSPEAAAASPKVSTLAQEAGLLATARRSYRRGDYAATLASLTEHAQRFPHGQLAEDRLALRARAQCDAGKNNAGKQTAAALRKAFPVSSQLARVARACAPTTAN